MSCPTSPPPEPARRPGGTSRRGLSLFRAGPAVLPPRRQCRLRWRCRWGRVRHWVRGGGEARCVARGLWGGGARRARAQHVLHRRGGLGGRSSLRPRWRPLPRWYAAAQGRQDAAECVRERRWGSPCLGEGGLGGACRAAGSTKAPASAGGERGVRPGAAPRPAGRHRGGPAAPPLGGAPTSSPQAESARGTGLGLLPPPAGWGDRGSVAPTPAVWRNIPPGTVRIARSGVWRFVGLEEPRSKAGGGRVPSTLGGAAHRRAAGGPNSGRACDAGRARTRQEDNTAAPARRASGTSTWRPGATRGGVTGQLEPPERPAWPTWPARQQRLMPKPRLLQQAHNGAPCSKQSAPCVPLPAPGGGLRCGAARGTLLVRARGDRRA